MKQWSKALFSLALAILMIVGCGVSFAEGDEPAEQPGETETQTVETAGLSENEIALVGYWIVVDGEGTDYSKEYVAKWNDYYSRLLFCIDRRDGEAKLVMLDGLVTGNVIGIVELGEDGVFSMPEIAKAQEEDYGDYLTFTCRLEDAEECNPLIWENVFAGWSDLKEYSADLLKDFYEQNTKDRMILHITGYHLENEEKQKPIDTTLTLEKVLPLFFSNYDYSNLNGTWVDNFGNQLSIILDSDGDLECLQLTDTKGTIYKENAFALSHYVDNGVLRFRDSLYFESESGDEIDVYITDFSFDGNQFVIMTKEGNQIVLTPAA